MGMKIESPLTEATIMQDLRTIEDIKERYENMAEEVEVMFLTKGNQLRRADVAVMAHVSKLQSVSNYCANLAGRIRVASRTASQLNLIGELLDD